MNTLKPFGIALLISLTASCGLGDDDDKHAQKLEDGKKMSHSTSVTGESAPKTVEPEVLEQVAVKQEGAGGGAVITGIDSAVEEIADGAESFVNKAVEGVAEGAEDVAEGAKELAESAVEGTKEVISETGEAVTEGAGKLKEAAVVAGSAVVAAGVAAKDKVAEVVSDDENSDVIVKEAEVNAAPIEEVSTTSTATNTQIQAADSLVQQLEEALEAAKKARASLN